MPRLPTQRLLVLLAIVFAIAGAWAIRSFTTNGRPQEPLRIEARDLEFGPVWDSQEFRWTFHIENTYGYPLRDVKLAASCDCTKLAPSSVSLNPGERATVEVTIDLTRAKSRPRASAKMENDESPGSIGETITVDRDVMVEIKSQARGIHGGDLPDQIWRIHGLVRRAFSVSPGSVSFGDSLVATQTFAKRTVQIRAHTPLQFILGSAPSEMAQIDVPRFPDAEGAYELTIRPYIGLGVGDYHFDIRLQAETTQGESLPPFRIPVTMRVLDDVQATPSKIAFGASRVGATVSETLVIQSRTNAVLDIACMPPEVPDISVTEIAHGAHFKQFQIAQQATQDGEHSATVQFIVRRRGEEDLLLPVTVRYLGVTE